MSIDPNDTKRFRPHELKNNAYFTRSALINSLPIVGPGALPQLPPLSAVLPTISLMLRVHEFNIGVFVRTLF